MKSRVICQKCHQPLTDWLEPVDEDFVAAWPESENMIPPGHYWIADADMNILEGRVIIHLDDRRGMRNHPDSRRFQGCCGPSAGRVNLLCGCGAEVATEVSDCWTSFYAHFEPDTTVWQSFPQADSACSARTAQHNKDSKAAAFPPPEQRFDSRERFPMDMDGL